MCEAVGVFKACLECGSPVRNSKQVATSKVQPDLSACRYIHSSVK
jgi:hypothetical protein